MYYLTLKLCVSALCTYFSLKSYRYKNQYRKPDRSTWQEFRLSEHAFGLAEKRHLQANMCTPKPFHWRTTAWARKLLLYLVYLSVTAHLALALLRSFTQRTNKHCKSSLFDHYLLNGTLGLSKAWVFASFPHVEARHLPSMVKSHGVNSFRWQCKL